jgi:uncharacterized protein YndB with AHSA1/START domain
VPRFEESRIAAAPDDVVWSLLTDPDHVPRWLTVATEVRPTGASGPGQRLRARGRAMGVSAELDLEVVTWEPHRRYAWRIADPLTVEVAFELDPTAPARCSLLTVVDADLGRRRSVRARMAVRVLRGEVSRSLDELVTLAEAGHA